MHLAITGPAIIQTPTLRHADVDEITFLAIRDCELIFRRELDVLVSGGAYGIDSIVPPHALTLYPEAHVHLIVPATLQHNTGLYQQLSSMAPDRVRTPFEVPGSYMDRNDAVIANSTRLLAFPETKTELQRSGTWATVRRARKARMDVAIVPLDTGEGWLETRSKYPFAHLPDKNVYFTLKQSGICWTRSVL
jgi:hypothetical protein